MSDEPRGSSAFLERITGELKSVQTPEDGENTPSPSKENAPPPAPTGTSAAPEGGELEDLEPPAAAPTAPAAADDDDLLAGLNEDPAPEPPKEGESEDTPPPADGPEFLAELDPDIRAKVEEHITDSLAKELGLINQSGNAFKRYKSENSELKTQLAELKAKGADSEALSEATAKIADLEKQIALQGEVDTVTKLQDTPAWKNEVIEPLRAVLDASDRIADCYGVDKEKLSDLLEITDRRELSTKVNQLLGEDAVDADKFELYDLARKVEATYAKRSELEKNSEAALREAEELATRAREREALEARKIRRQSAEATLERVRSRAAVIADTLGDEATAATLKYIEDTPFDQLGAENQAFALFASKAITPLTRQLMSLQTALEEKEDELIALRRAKPGAAGGGGGGTPTPESTPSETDNRPFAERAAARIQSRLVGV